MKWFKGQFGVVLTLAIVIGSGLVTWGKMQQVCTRIEEKADKQSVEAIQVAISNKAEKEAMLSIREGMMRELTQIQQQLSAINTRLDGVIVRQAIIGPQK
jgi:uncharacterized protein HemX